MSRWPAAAALCEGYAAPGQLITKGVKIGCRLTAERAVKPIAIGRENWMFAGSEGGGKAMAIAFILIQTAKLNGIGPQSWLSRALERIADHKVNRLDELMPWCYTEQSARH